MKQIGFLVLLLISMAIHLGCKTKKRTGKITKIFSIDLDDNLLLEEKRDLIPFISCKYKKSLQLNIFGLKSKAPHKKFNFITKNESPLPLGAVCNLEVSSDDIDGLKILNPSFVAPRGNSILYFTKEFIYLKDESKIKFIKNYEHLIVDPIVTTLNFKFLEKDDLDKVVFLCDETKTLTGEFNKENKNLKIAIRESVVVGNPQTLSNCFLKNENEQVFASDLPFNLNYNLSQVIHFKVTGKLTKDGNRTDYYRRFNGSKYVTLAGNCKFVIEFFSKDQESYYSEYVLEQPDCPITGGAVTTDKYKIFDRHFDLEGILSKQKLLFKFYNGKDQPSYSIIESIEGGIVKIGGNVISPKKLALLSEGLQYKLYSD